MIPKHYFEVLCCPKCRGELAEKSAGIDRLLCLGCGAEYPVVEGIPILLDGAEDEVSRKVAQFYESAWKRDESGQLRAKLIHEDTTDLGQRYIELTEKRFLAVFKGQRGRRRFFLDAASGAQPRLAFAANHEYHVCLDFSLDGLIECRHQIGSRAVCVCGSLLRAPIKDAVCDGILASHCLYHIDRDLQSTAIREMLRVLAPRGKLLLFYANPANIQSPILAHRAFARLTRQLQKLPLWKPPPAPPPPREEPLYFYLHPLDFMVKELSGTGGLRVQARPLCLFNREESEPVFKSKPLGRLGFVFYLALEKAYARRPESAFFLAYVVTKSRRS